MPTGTHKLDQFESMFRSALHERFHFEPPLINHVLLITDMDVDASAALSSGVRQLVDTVASGAEWDIAGRAAWAEGPQTPLDALLARITTSPPDLIVTYRHLLGLVRDMPHTLGSIVDVLTQATTVPVLLLPPLDRQDFQSLVQRDSRRVMVVTDHITGDDRLVNWGVHATSDRGTLYLAHIEDDATLSRYLDAIDRLPAIDSEIARAEIPKKLLELPHSYIDTIAGVLREHDVVETVVPVVRMGHGLTDYRRLVEEHDIDLIIMNTKDAQQSAMHALAAALAVEIRNRPLLLL